MKKIPCKNCICFPICKSQAMMEKFGGGRYIRIDILHKKCKVFEKWHNIIEIEHISYPIAEVKECFNVSSASWGKW
jgi:hypothetical protein